ncbi:MAG: hypothetical protein H6671_13935 [Anaerolineaceae bacterium]|nr:hypothetical protein [Anaerolineaceae bacterium]
MFFRREPVCLFFITLIVWIGEQFQHIIKWPSALTSGDLDKLNEFFERLSGREAIAVESEV